MESMKSDKEFSEGIIGWGLFALVLALIGMLNTGCAQLVGVKEVHRHADGSSDWYFTSATDFTVGWGQYDSADKYKGIKPGGYSSKGRATKARAETVDPD